MKHILLFCTCLFAATIQAQSINPVRFGIQGNFTNINLPGPTINGVEPLKDVYGPGWGGGVHLDFNIPMFTFRVSGDYVTFAPDNDKFRENLALMIGSAASDFTITGGRINILSGAVNGKLQILPLPVVSPYLTGGVGLAKIDVEDAQVIYQGQPSNTFSGPSSETKTLFNAGAGVDVNIIGVSMYLEVKYTWVLTDETSTYVPVTLGVTF